MSNTTPTYNDEIDLLSLMETVWKGKWKIASIVAASLLSVFVFNIVKPNKNFITTTEIKPITSSEFDKYRMFNSSLKNIGKEKKEEKKEKKEKKEEKEKVDKASKIFEITQQSLLTLYVEQIEEGSILESAIDKFNLINKDDFDNEREYKDAVEKFVSEIEILRPIEELVTAKKSNIRLHHVLKGEYDDEDKWKDLLTFVNNEVNRKVKLNLINRFKTVKSIYNQNKAFAIKDMEIKINNAKKDYERYTKDRLAFLAEQAAIARKLDIAKNTIASQRFTAQNTFVTTFQTDPLKTDPLKTDSLFYLRGYLAIEEEMKQIIARKNKDSFVKNLFTLQQQKRKLEQDETIERANDLFYKTPLNQKDFQASIVKVATTDFISNNNENLYYALAIILGGIIGVVYVLIANAFKNR